jgi:hypothetical protein
VCTSPIVASACPLGARGSVTRSPLVAPAPVAADVAGYPRLNANAIRCRSRDETRKGEGAAGPNNFDRQLCVCQKQGSRTDWLKSQKRRAKPAATGNKRLSDQTRKILGKHHASKYRG